MNVLYFDNNATTQVAPEVLEAMLPWLRENYANAAAPYRFGRAAEEAVEQARAQLADLLAVRGGRELVFTSGATEANAMALHSALALQPEKRHIVTSAVEHSSIRLPLKQLEGREGYRVTWLPVDAQGRLNPAEFAAALTPDTALATIMWANNETGVVFPIAELAAIARERQVPFHTDATQALGKIPVRPWAESVGMLSLAAHKFHGPKGIGALWISPRQRFLTPTPGSQESERRGGTSNVPGIVGLGAAAALAGQNQAASAAAMARLRDFLETTLRRDLPGLAVNGADAPRGPNTSSIRLPAMEAESMLLALDQARICVSTGSACSTGSLAPSHVLTAMGQTQEEARRALRISLSRYTTRAEIETLAQALVSLHQAWNS